MEFRHPEILYCGTYAGDRHTSLHRHDGAELVFVEHGRCANVITGGMLTAGVGQMFVIPPEMPHRQIDYGAVQTTYAVFEPIGEGLNAGFRVIDTSRDAFVSTWMRQLLALYRLKSLTECNLLLELLLLRLVGIEREIPLQTALPEPIRAAVDFLAIHFTEKLGMEELARRHSLSPSYFNALFRRHLGQSPAAYVCKLRMSYARRLLLTSRMSIAETGALCGYDNLNYFVRLFRQRHGCTPGEYRTGAGAKAEDLEL